MCSKTRKGCWSTKENINVLAEATIVQPVLSPSPAGHTWKANPKHALDLIKWAGLDQSNVAAPTPGTAATQPMTSAVEELPKQRHELEAQRVDTRRPGHLEAESANGSETKESCTVSASGAGARLDIPPGDAAEIGGEK